MVSLRQRRKYDHRMVSESGDKGLVLSVGERKYGQSGWVPVGGRWYYLSASGEMAHDGTTPDGYKVNANGAWVDANGKEYDAPGGEQKTSGKRSGGSDGSSDSDSGSSSGGNSSNSGNTGNNGSSSENGGSTDIDGVKFR